MRKFSSIFHKYMQIFIKAPFLSKFNKILQLLISIAVENIFKCSSDSIPKKTECT